MLTAFFDVFAGEAEIYEINHWGILVANQYVIKFEVIVNVAQAMK